MRAHRVERIDVYLGEEHASRQKSPHAVSRVFWAGYEQVPLGRELQHTKEARETLLAEKMEDCVEAAVPKRLNPAALPAGGIEYLVWQSNFNWRPTVIGCHNDPEFRLRVH